MRFVTWNFGMALARKAPSLSVLNQDIAILRNVPDHPSPKTINSAFGAEG